MSPAQPAKLLPLVVIGQITKMVNTSTHTLLQNLLVRKPFTGQKAQSGFNLVELVIVIVVAGILATVVAPIVMKPFLAYEDRGDNRCQDRCKCHRPNQRNFLPLVVIGQITKMVNTSTHTLLQNLLVRKPFTGQKAQSGFNLVELVIVIVVAGILATVVAPIVMKPFLAYEDTSRRVALVDAAEAAMKKIAMDVRDAIPNTLRTNGAVLEIMPIRGGGRYRYSDIASDDTALTPGAVDDQFQMFGNISSIPSGARLVVYNTGATTFYTAATSGGAGIITPASTTVSMTNNGNEDTISLSSGFRFDLYGTGSPQKRFFLATTPVTYHCDTSTGNIRRYGRYATAVTQPASRSAALQQTMQYW